MSQACKNLLSLLDLEQVEDNLFRGHSPQNSTSRVFGGQGIGQALVAAARTVQKRSPHALHAHFLRPGDPSTPILYEVERTRDGGSFSTRRLVARQHNDAIFIMSASFQIEESGFEHQATMPDVPSPDALANNQMMAANLEKMPAYIQAYLQRERPIELRPVEMQRYLPNTPLKPSFHVWFRASGSLPDDPSIHHSILAYASDMTLIDASLMPHGRSVFESSIQAASLDHALWIHRPFRMDDWLLYAQDSPSSSGGRGLSRGLIFNQAGQLVASVAQEGLIRDRANR